MNFTRFLPKSAALTLILSVGGSGRILAESTASTPGPVWALIPSPLADFHVTGSWIPHHGMPASRPVAALRRPEIGSGGDLLVEDAVPPPHAGLPRPARR